MENSGIKQLLVELESELDRTHAPILHRLNQGRTENELRDIFGGMQILDDVYALYMWKDGTDTTNAALGKCWLFKMGALIPAQKAVQYYKKFVNRDEYWIDGMFPLFESLGGDFYLIDINSTSPTYGFIFFYYPGAVDFEVIISKYDSLETLVRTILECFRRGAYFYDKNALTLEFTPELEREITKNNNPRSAYWTLFT